MHDIIKILRSISILGFLFANIFMGIFFHHFISNIPVFIYVIIFVVSFMVLKTDYVICKFDLLKIKNKKENFGQIDKKDKCMKCNFSLLTEVINIKNLLVIFKQLFFNTLYELFPICIIWVCFLGLLFFTNLFDIHPLGSFYNVVTVLGILLGVFQFYLQRYEEKIASKIGISERRIEFIINEETSFEKFYDSLPDKSFNRNCLRNWISKKTDPKLQILDSLQFLAENDNAVNVISRIIRRSGSNTPILFNLTYPDSNKKFNLIEAAAEVDTKKRGELMKAYKHFFDGEETFNTIIKRVNEEIDIKQFGAIALGNINIFSEVLPQFINSQLKDFIDKITDVDKEKNKEYIDFGSSKEFRKNLHFRVMDEIFSKILF